MLRQMLMFMSLSATAAQAQYVPYTKPPLLINRDVIRHEVDQAVISLVPAGKKLTTLVWLTVTTAGRTTDVNVRESSGVAAADSAALRIVRLMRWQPGEKDGSPVAVKVTLPVVFTAQSQEIRTSCMDLPKNGYVTGALKRRTHRCGTDVRQHLPMTAVNAGLRLER
jgi:TonB family protein